MKKITKRIFSAILSAIMLILALPLTGFATSKTSVGEYETVKFGSYPQSQVKDLTLISKLNSVNKNWISYHYYTGENTYGTMKPGNWMKYADFKYDGNKYRAVTFSQYRPCSTLDVSSETYSYQDDNGYYINNVYYFLYEPIKWRAYYFSEGQPELVSDMILDSQPFNNIVYKLYRSDFGRVAAYYPRNICNGYEDAEFASMYLGSTIQKWLENDFYNVAFNVAQQSEIADISLMHYTTSGSQMTLYDELYLPDHYPYVAFTRNEERRGVGTDYAKAQGLYVDPNQFNSEGLSYSPWWLKDTCSGDAGMVEGWGSCIIKSENLDGDPGFSCVSDSEGIRPVIRLNNLVIKERGIVSVNVGAPAYLGETTKVSVKVKSSPSKIRMVNSESSLTIDRNNPAVIDIISNSDNTELWIVNLKVKSQTTRYTIYAEYDKAGWYDEGYTFSVKAQERIPDKDVYSFSIDECYDDVMYAGVHKVTVETGVDATKVQFYKDGNTWTYSADNASYVIEDDKKIWSINMNFSELGEDMEYYIRTRSQKSAFEFTDQVMNVWVRFK